MKKFLVAIGVLLFAAALAFTGFTLVKMIQKQQAAPASAQEKVKKEILFCSFYFC